MPESSPRFLPAALAAIVTALVLALALGGCGGSGAATTGAARVTTTVTRTATRSTASAPPQSASSTTGPGTASAGSGTAGGSTATTPRTAAGPPPCVAAGLALTFLGGQGATGHGELGFALRNTGSASCSTVGYPGVQFLDGSGGPLPTTPTHTTDDFFGHTSDRPLVVAPGQSASFRLGVTHGAGSSAGCTTAHALQVIAPNDTATLRVSLPNGGASECGATTVSPLQSGDTAFR